MKKYITLLERLKIDSVFRRNEMRYLVESTPRIDSKATESFSMRF